MPKTKATDGGPKVRPQRGSLTPRQIPVVRRVNALELSQYHEVLAESIMAAFDDTEDKAGIRARIMSAITSGAMQLWVILSRERNAKLLGTGTTRLVKDPIDGNYKLFIYSLHCAKNTRLEAWEQAYRILEEYARTQQCNAIVGVTHNVRVLEIAKHIGMNVRFMLEKGVD